MTKESSITKILQFSVIIQVQERLSAQSNASHEQSTLKLLISGFHEKLPKKESKFTENQAADIFTKSLARPLFQKFKKRLGLISSKETWPIISFSCLTWCTKPRGGQLRNCVSRFWGKKQRRNSENQIYLIFNPASDSDLEEGVNEKQHHESRRWSTIYITEVVYTVPNRSSALKGSKSLEKNHSLPDCFWP